MIHEDARAALKLVDVDPRRAWKRATELAQRAAGQGDHATESVAARAAGLAALHMIDVDTAIGFLEAAVASGRRAGSPRLTGEARMSLAYALTRRGEARRALRMIDTALGDLTGVEHARALAQRGAIRHQLGRLDEALADYRAALPALRREGDWTWVQRIHSNRSVLYIYRSELGLAAAELSAAEEVCRKYRLNLQLALVYDNLAFLHVRRGDVPAALHWLDAAEEAHTAVGARAGSVLIDRSELLLSVGLVAEARATAMRAVAEFTELRREILLPQAQLLVAETALLEGDAGAARESAEAAIRTFRAQRRTEWVALARYTAIRCRMRQSGERPVTVRDLSRAATALDAAGWTVPAMDARLVGARMALDRADKRRADERRAGEWRADERRAEELLDQAAPARRRGPVQLRARAWHAEALRRLARRDVSGAIAALQAGIRVIEDHQATLAAADLRSTISGHRADLVQLGLRLALAAGNPRQVLLWAERGRATALLLQPLRPPDDEVLAQLLVELRATVAAGRGALGRQAALERAIRDRVRATPGAPTPLDRPELDEIGDALGDAALIEYVENGGDLFAVTMVGRRVRLTPLGTAAALPTLTQQVPFALRRIRRSTGGPVVAAAEALLRHAAGGLDELLLGPIRDEIGDRPLVIIPTGPLQGMLWSVLPSCHGRPVTVAPSAALWHRAANAVPASGRVVVVAGPGLPRAPVEASTVAALYEGAELLVGPEATVASVNGAFRGSSIAHVAAHGRFRADNPLFSSLQMVDGPLTVYDLDALPQAPRVVVLAACDGGTSLVAAGDEVLGLAAGFLAHGTAALLGPLGPVWDDVVPELMVELHKELRDGTAPAVALASVQRAAAERSPAVHATAASLVCFGAGHQEIRPESYQGQSAGTL